MAHIRTQVRAEILAALAGMATPAAVYDERRLRIDASLLPCVILSLGQSDVEPDEASMGEPWLVQTVQAVTVELHAADDDGAALAATLDQLELEAETALAALNPSTIMEKLEPVSSALETSVDQDRVVGVRTLNWIATWRHKIGAADTPEG